MSDLLLITDMARLSKLFDRLADDIKFTLRVVNNLEKGGEEIAFKKPDVVFVQTHLSGLSADILLKHLKKQLGRKRSRFVLLATPRQVNDEILEPYQGWLDISREDGELSKAIQSILTSLLTKTKTSDARVDAEDRTVAAPVSPELASLLEISARLAPKTVATASGVFDESRAVVPTAETSLEDQGITYSPRQRLSIYSEFNSSFDNAINKTPEPKPLNMGNVAIKPLQEQNLPRGLADAPTEPEAPVKVSSVEEHAWNEELLGSIETVSPRSKRSTFYLWLAPVIVAVVIVTFIQKNRAVTKPVDLTGTPAASLSPPSKPADKPVPATIKNAETTSAPPVSSKTAQGSGMTDKAVVASPTENKAPKIAASSSPVSSRPSVLPDFIPRYGLDKQYAVSNPGWERYMGQITEFKVLREAGKIKAIQVIDRGGQGLPESFMRGTLRQVAKNPVFKSDGSEKKEGYTIERGQVSENLKVVYYRDEQGGKLRAFVMTWQ